MHAKPAGHQPIAKDAPIEHEQCPNGFYLDVDQRRQEYEIGHSQMFDQPCFHQSEGNKEHAKYEKGHTGADQ